MATLSRKFRERSATGCFALIPKLRWRHSKSLAAQIESSMLCLDSKTEVATLGPPRLVWYFRFRFALIPKLRWRHSSSERGAASSCFALIPKLRWRHSSCSHYWEAPSFALIPKLRWRHCASRRWVDGGKCFALIPKLRWRHFISATAIAAPVVLCLDSKTEVATLVSSPASFLSFHALP